MHWVALTGLVCAVAAFAQAPQMDTRERLARLAYNVQSAEDISAIKRLQRSYGYFVDKGLWTDLAEYFTDDAVANYPAGTFIGKASIREHLYRNVGNVPVGQVGLGDGRLYNHMNIQPVVHLDPGGNTARGRWRAFAMFGSFGGNAMWAEGVYEMQYRKDGGVWKIAHLDYYSGFGAPYATGWVAPQAPADGAAPAARPARQLAHPADQPRNVQCDGFPKACIAPFHYANPGTPEGGRAWRDLGAHPLSKDGQPAIDADNLARRAALLLDEQQIENLQRIYGYYLDRAQWDQMADLFADRGTIEVAQQGVYVGRQRVREYLGTLGPAGLEAGWLNDHIQLQPIVTVAADGLSARIRSREFSMTGHVGGKGQWSEGIYENTLVKERGAWKFSAVHFYPTFITDYDQGWSKDAEPAPGPLAGLPPDRPPSEKYAIFPKQHIPPFHFPNPVTGKPVTYPAGSGAAPTLAVFRPAPGTGGSGGKRAMPGIDVVLATAEHDIARVQDYDEIENLESAYGYYLDKNLWNPLADTFARDGSIELAQRGVYKGPRLREFLVTVFGRGQEGPVEGRLGNHLNLQPVITVADNGKTARVRARMLQQMSMGGRASIGGAIYENEIVKEDGIWKFGKVHAWNTFGAGYDGGWAKSPGTSMPGPAAGFAPDEPPTAVVSMLPIVYEIPYHYANPVTGRTALAPVPPLAVQQAQFPPAPPSAPRGAAGAQAPAPAPQPASRPASPPGMSAEIAAALREIGAKIEGQRTTALYAPLHAALNHDGVQVRRDEVYGPDERHRANVFTARGATGTRPILMFVYGGGFARGTKSSPGQFAYDNIGYWAAEHGLVGVVMDYRLAPQFQYPSGADDVARAVQWLREHAREFGGDPERIFLWGHSAGGAHVADYLVRTPRPAVAGAVILSGVLQAGPTWKSYFGEDESRYAAMSALPKLFMVPVPVLVAWAELDPPDFVPETEQLVAGRKAAGMPTVALQLPNHSHLSEAYAVGTADEMLSGAVLQFIKAPPR